MPPEIVLYLSISCLIINIGLLLNGFIMVESLFRWMKCQTLQTIDVLITSLGLVRFIILSLYMDFLICLITDRSPFQIDYTGHINTVFLGLVFCSLWWGSLLCVFYCVKITNYRNRLFNRLKMKISKMVPWLLLVSLVISFLTSLPNSWCSVCFQVNGTNDGNGVMEHFNIFIISTGSVIPFMISCVAIYLIIVSLLRHTRSMSGRDSGFSTAQRDIHFSVIWSMVSFLLFYLLYLVAWILFTNITDVTIFELSATYFMCICAYPSLHSMFLIFSNKELKNSFCAFLSCTFLRNLKRPSP